LKDKDETFPIIFWQLDCESLMMGLRWKSFFSNELNWQSNVFWRIFCVTFTPASDPTS